MLSSGVVFHFTVLCIVNHIHGATKLYPDIAPTDTISEVINQIFSSLKFIPNSQSKIKEYSKMHKYFVSLPRLEKNDWMKLLKLTSIDSKIDNGTVDYMTAINEILNEGNKTEASNAINEENVNNHIENFLGTLANVKELYLRNSSYITVNYDMLRQFHKARLGLRNNSIDYRLHLTQNDPDFWVPSGRRVYQGKRTKIKNFPFLASVHMFNQFTCAGSIIDEDLVITAASCLQLVHNNRFYRENPSFLSVRVGSSYYLGGDHIPVLEVYFYPTYEPKTLRNNLAIMRLQRVINFSKRNKNVKKIRLDTKAHPLPSNTDGITIIGWGARKANNKIAFNPWKNKMAMAVLYFYGLADCRDIYTKAFVTKTNFCAGFISHGGGACHRDVGAPGVVGGILAGVVSFGSPNCGTLDSPTVFTKLGYYIDWIEDIMEQDPPKLSVRMTTRRPYIFHSIKSTPPPNDMNFLVEPIDLSKVPDLKDLDVRMPQGETQNELINTEFPFQPPTNSEEIYTNISYLINETSKEFIDLTRLRELGLTTRSSTETPYEPPRFEAFHTIMDDFDVKEIPSDEADKWFEKKVTPTDTLDRTKPEKIQSDKPEWQFELNEDTGSVEDATEITIDIEQFDSKVSDKGFVANNTISEKVVSSDDYSDEKAAMQPIDEISNEKGLSVENLKINGHLQIFNSKNKKAGRNLDGPTPMDNDNFLLQNHMQSKYHENTVDPIFQYQETTAVPSKKQNVFSLPYQEKKQLSTIVEDLLLQYKEKKTTPTKYRFPLQYYETESASKSDIFPSQYQETTAAPSSDHVSKFLNQKKKLASTIDELFPFQHQDTKQRPSTIDDEFQLHYYKTNPESTNDVFRNQTTKPTPLNHDMFTSTRREEKPATTIDDVFPLHYHDMKQDPNDDELPSLKQNAKPAPIDASQLKVHKPNPKKIDDVIAFLYLSDSERKPLDKMKKHSETEGLGVDAENFEDLTYINLLKGSGVSIDRIFDIIAEKLTKNIK